MSSALRRSRLRLQLAALVRQLAGQEPRAMGSANPRTVHSPITRRRELGALLHALRVHSGLTVRQVAERLMCSENKVRRMEANFRAGTPRDVRDLCDLYGVTDEAERDRMITLAVEGKQPAWWQSYDLSYEKYVGLEADALVISAFQSSVVHGLLQTAEYARANHEGAMPRFSPERIERQIEAKLTRQEILVRDNPPRLTVVLDEAALRRMVGGRQVMAAQLAKILEMSALPNVVVQVLPFERGAHPALESNFTVLELPSPAPDVVYVEGLMDPIYLERPEELKRSHDVFRRLRSIALSPEGTAAWIADLAQYYETSILAIKDTKEQESPMSLPDQVPCDHHWRKARRSANDGACVEVALVNGQIAVHDSKNPSVHWLQYSMRQWRDFTFNVKTRP